MPERVRHNIVLLLVHASSAQEKQKKEIERAALCSGGFWLLQVIGVVIVVEKSSHVYSRMHKIMKRKYYWQFCRPRCRMQKKLQMNCIGEII